MGCDRFRVVLSCSLVRPFFGFPLICAICMILCHCLLYTTGLGRKGDLKIETFRWLDCHYVWTLCRLHVFGGKAWCQVAYQVIVE